MIQLMNYPQLGRGQLKSPINHRNWKMIYFKSIGYWLIKSKGYMKLNNTTKIKYQRKLIP